MEKFALDLDPTIRYHVFTLTIDPDGNSLRVRVELRYLNQPELWYLSIFDAATDEAFCRYVPVIASYNEPNNLLAPFRQKGIGSIYCIAVASYPSSQDPGLENLGEFELVWGDTDET